MEKSHAFERTKEEAQGLFSKVQKKFKKGFEMLKVKVPTGHPFERGRYARGND